MYYIFSNPLEVPHRGFSNKKIIYPAADTRYSKKLDERSALIMYLAADTLYSKKLDERSALIMYPAADTLYSKKLDERSALITTL